MNQDPSIQTAEEITNPTVKLAAKTVIPPRTLVLVTILTTLPPCEEKTRFDFVPIQVNFHLGPNCYCIPFRLCIHQRRVAEGTTNIDKFRSTRCKVTAGNSVGALPKGPI